MQQKDFRDNSTKLKGGTRGKEKKKRQRRRSEMRQLGNFEMEQKMR
jgi:hypothetical protein